MERNNSEFGNVMWNGSFTFKNWPDKMTSPTFPASRLMYWITHVCSSLQHTSEAASYGRQIPQAPQQQWSQHAGGFACTVESTKAHGVVGPSPENGRIEVTVADVPLASILVELQRPEVTEAI